MLLCAAAGVQAMERVTLRNGFAMDCMRREAVGERVRLYLIPGAGAQADGGGEASYVEVAKDAVATVEDLPDPVAARTPATRPEKAVATTGPTAAEMHEMLAHAGVEHRVDADLLASVVRAESGGQVRAVSRVGARGLMQLMPETATELGVKDAFRAKDNIDGGSAYLDQLLTRYHDDMALALAAYNAGPAAVDRYHGVPPYRETRAYVARVIREFNRRKLAER